MLSSQYVDNITTGYATTQQATQFYSEARVIMSDARFNLQAWTSNCNQLSILAQQESVANDATTVNVLGLQ